MLYALFPGPVSNVNGIIQQSREFFQLPSYHK